MDPDSRTAILVGGLAFCVFLGLLTINAMIEGGFDIFIVVSLFIVGMIATGLVGAIRNPPPDD